MAGIRTGNLRDLFRGAGGDYFATLVATLGAEINDPVGGFYDVQVVFNDGDGIAVIA